MSKRICQSKYAINRHYTKRDKFKTPTQVSRYRDRQATRTQMNREGTE